MTDEDSPQSDDATDEAGAALTIADAARAGGTDRHSIRRKLHAGEFPRAFKDEQGFWRIYESDLHAAGLRLGGSADADAAVDSEAAGAEPSEPGPSAERRLNEQLGQALQAARRTGEALLASVTGPSSDPRPSEPRPVSPPAQPRVNWQAGLRAARARDAEQRAAREREERQRAASTGENGS
jgi:threonine dehydrogenase-like Zn-dependent dehydrogenase